MTALVAAATLGSVVPAVAVGAATRGTAAASVPASTARLAASLVRTNRTAAPRSARDIQFSMFVRDRISCASPTACLAIGLTTDSAGRVTGPEAESLHGTEWRPVVVKAPKGAAYAMLNGVSCKAATFCLAVGAWQDKDGTTRPAAWALNGTALTPAPPPPMPSGSSLDVLSAVSCVAVKSCVVIGSAWPSHGGKLQIVWTWNGRNWARKAVTLPGTSDGQLTAAHCFSLTSCEVGGITTPDTGNTDAESLLLASWNGKAFTSQQAGAVNLVFGSVNGVSCSSPSHCAVVGINVANDTNNSPMTSFAEVRNGATWTATKWAGPKGATNAALDGVSCTSATSCVAAGMAGSLQVPHVAALIFNGTRWSVVTAPSAGAGLWAGFEDVSCPKPGDCVAIGRYGKPADNSGKLLAGYWNGRAWKLKAA